MWLLGAFWPLTLAHLALELVHGYQWLWIAYVPLLALASTLLWRNWPRGHVPALLRVLFLGYAWLPIALALRSEEHTSELQSLRRPSYDGFWLTKKHVLQIRRH